MYRPASPNPSLEKHSYPQCPAPETGGLSHHPVCDPLVAGPSARSLSLFRPSISQWLFPGSVYSPGWSLSICPSELPEPVPGPAIFLAFTLEWLGYLGLVHSGPEARLTLSWRMAFCFLLRQGPTLTQVTSLSWTTAVSHHAQLGFVLLKTSS